MIALHKLPKPQWLLDNADTKTLEYIAASPKTKPSPWRHPDVVATLKQESSKKCMYCESIIDDSGYSAVEHIKPKGEFPRLVLEWENLGLVCDRCNTNKGTYWTDDDDLRLLNPYVDTISDHLNFDGPLTLPSLGSTRGKNTVRKLKFTTREDLLMQRSARIEELHAKLELWHGETKAELKVLYSEDVVEMISVNSEYSGVLRAYAERKNFPVPSQP